jgi:hypothetical protein
MHLVAENAICVAGHRQKLSKYRQVFKRASFLRGSHLDVSDSVGMLNTLLGRSRRAPVTTFATTSAATARAFSVSTHRRSNT